MFKRRIADIVSSRIGEPRRMMQVVAGPRQVGKTFAVKQALKEYSEGFTYRLAEGLSVSPLTWLESEWNAARMQAKSKGGHLLVMDEIHKIKGWSDLVKRLWDEDSFNDVPLKVLLLGSSRLLLQQGLAESLEGRFELLEARHWSFAEMRDAFGFTVDDYVAFGAYPGAAAFKGDEARWRGYIRDSIIEPSIAKDILQMENIAKPALLRQVFALGCRYSARILSYQKMLGQLQDAGNATTLAHYLHLLGEAGLVKGLDKFYVEGVRQKASSPKLAVCNNALMTAMAPYGLAELRTRPDIWGHVVESAVGAHLLATAEDGMDVMYWNEGGKEVDYVLRKGDSLAALEVKTGNLDDISGMKAFLAKYPHAKPYLIGNPGMSFDDFFLRTASDFLQ